MLSVAFHLFPYFQCNKRIRECCCANVNYQGIDKNMYDANIVIDRKLSEKRLLITKILTYFAEIFKKLYQRR
jgi:hypothetical protein